MQVLGALAYALFLALSSTFIWSIYMIATH